MVNPIRRREHSRGGCATFFMLLALLLAATIAPAARAQDSDDGLNAQEDRPAERDYYKIVDIPIPEGIVLEVGGLLAMEDGRLMVATRRGFIHIIDGVYGEAAEPTWTRYASGLSQPLGLLALDGWVYSVQRGELTRMKDTDGDDRADVFRTVSDGWQISGNYHEYAFGPALDGEGYLWVTLNKPFGGEPFGRADWRGWAVKIDPDTGEMLPQAVGLRSPAGVEASPTGQVFYTDNQGEWCNASKLSLLEFGDFHGHPHGLPTAEAAGPPFDRIPHPESGTYMKDLHKQVPQFKMPAVWFPYNKMGESPSGLVWDTTGGDFGPFAGQLFVGDQHHAWVIRVFLEKIGGHWQGACFEFRRGFESGVTRLEFGRDGALFVGMSNRGWGGLGGHPYGLQRLVWTGETPMEIHEMRATPRGFELSFTKPVNPETAADPGAYSMTSYTYKLRSAYGGPEADKKELRITSAKVSDDRRRVRLTIEPLRAGYVHEVHIDGLRANDGAPLLHDTAYYTLVNIPEK